MKMKSFNGVTRRRGTTVAAAALSVALVTPFVHPVVNPGASPVAAAQDAASAQDRSVDSRGTSEATAIRADGTWGQKKGYQGTVYLDRDGSPDDQDDADEAMPGVKVFLQYANGKGQVSPIYYTTSDSEGKFVFNLSKAPKDGLGNPVEFKLAGDEKFRVRTWAENPNPAKYTLAAGGDMYTGRFHNRTTRKWESWDFTAGINRIVGSKVVFQERPNVDGWLAKPEAEWTEAPTADKKWPEGGDYGTARGNVWWENNEAEGSLSNQYYKGPSDRAATNVKVVGSYVNDEVARKFDAWKAANKNYTREQFRVAQKEIVDKYQAEHGAGSHIAESRVAYLKDNGSFYLPFAGLYGIDRNKKGSKTTDEEWGTLVSKKDEEHGNLMQWNGTLGQRHRHINSDYMYLYPVVGDNRDLWMGNYQDNMFQPPHGGNLGIELESANIVFQNFALLTPRPLHDVYNFDNTSSLAAPGDTAKSKTTGLVPNQTYAIEWFADGQSTGKTCTVKANEKGELESCDLTVPKNLSKATVYSSQVFAADASGKPTGTLLLADSFLADPTFVRYEDTTGTAKEKDLEAKPSFDNPNTDAVEEKPEGATFEFADPAAAEKLGLSTDDIDPKTGAVKWPADKQVEGENEVLVKVTWTPAEGADSVSREVPAKFILDAPAPVPAPSIAAGSETDEVPADGSEKTLDDKVENPTDGMTGEVLDKDGNPIKDATVTVDPDTGEIKVTVPEGTAPQDGKVVVKDKNGDKVGEVDVKITEPKSDVPAPSIAAGSETDEVPADGSEKTLDDKVENPTDGMTGEVLDKDGNPIKDATVTVDPDTGEIKVTVPEGTAPQDGKVVVKDKNGDKVGEVDVKITEPKSDVPAPSIAAGSETDEVPADGSEKTLDDKVENPTDGMTGEVLDKDGNPIKDATVTVDPDTGEIKVTVPEGTAPQDGKVVVKDKNGDKVGEVDVKITEPKSDVPAPSIAAGSETDEVPADGSEKTLDDKVENPTDGMTGEVLDKDGNPIKDATVTVDPDTGEIKVTVPEGTAPQDGKVVVKDKNGDKVGEVDVKITEPKSDVPAPSIAAGSETDEVPADGSEKTLDDKVENPTDGMTGEVLDKDGNPIKDATVTVDPDTGEIKVTVPEGTAPQDGKVVVKDKNGDKVGEVDVKITEPKSDVPAPSIAAGSETDEVPADGSEKTLDDKVENPTDGMTGEVLDKDGNPIKDATVTVDPDTGEIKVTVPEGTAPQDGKVVVKDKNGDKVGEVDVKITEPKSDVPAPSIAAGSETDEVPADGSEKTLDDKVENPTDGMTGEVLDKDGNPIKDATVTVDPDTGEIKVTVPEGTAPQDGKVVVKDKNGDKVGEVDVKITEPKSDVPDTSNASVVPDAVTVVEGQEAKPFEVAKNIPEGGKVVVDGLPDGLSVDESTGEVAGTPAEISDWGKDEEERDVEVTVSVTDKDGKEVAQGTKTVTVQRDTDGDGQPDVTDTDDDNDGATDAEEAEAGTDPKDADSKPAPTDEPSVVSDTETVVEGQEAKPFEVAKNIPEGGKVVVDGLPDGLSVDESTGEVAGTPAEISDWGKDEEERDVEVTVSVTDKDGKEVAQGTKTVTVQRDTDGDGQPDVTDTDDDNDGATDAEEAEAGTDPKDANSKPEAKPGDDQGATSVDKSGVKDVKPSGEDQNTGIKVTNPDEGTKVSATDKNGKDVPAKIDDNGNVVVTPGEDVEGPITVVIEDEDLDGGKTEIEVGVKDEEPGNQGGSSNVPGGSSIPSGSSNVDWKRCAPAAAGVGLPLLFLLPIGLASQMNIPGFSPLVKQVSAQIDGINRQLGQQNVALQKQLGIYNGPLAKQANQVNLMLKKVSPEAGRIGGGVALAAAGALALGLLINSCAPGAGSSSSSK